LYTQGGGDFGRTLTKEKKKKKKKGIS